MSTFLENDLLLKTAITLSENSVKHIAAESGIKANTLYKWKTTNFLQRFHLLSWPLPFYMMKRLPESLPGCQIDLDSDAEQIPGKTICRFGSVAPTIVGAKAPVALSFSDQTAQSAVRA